MANDFDELSPKDRENIRTIIKALARQAAREYFDAYQAAGGPPEGWEYEEEIEK